MKKNDLINLLVIAMFVIVGVGFTACGSDDDDDVKPLAVSPSSVSM